MKIYTVEFYGDDFNTYTEFIGEKVKALEFINKFPADKSYVFKEWQLNSNKSTVLEQPKKILNNAEAWVAEKRAAGWTKADFVQELGRMLGI